MNLRHYIYLLWFLLCGLFACFAVEPLEIYNAANCVPYSLNNTAEWPATYCRIIPQWYLHDTGETSLLYQNGLPLHSGDEPGGSADLNLPADLRANGVIVGIIDTGCRSDHEDLQGVILGGCAISERQNPVITEGVFNDYDPNGHGTGIASIIAAERNGIGMAGVAPGAKLLIVSTGLALPETTTQIAKGIVWLVNRGAKVICLSWGETDLPNPELLSAIQLANLHGVIVVSAVRYGGNLDLTPTYPYAWNFPLYLAVAATTRLGALYPPSATGSRVVGAPGDRIVMASVDDNYVYDNGNSFASPMVAGVLALMIAQRPKQSPWSHPWQDAFEKVVRLKASCQLHPVAGILGRVNGVELDK